MISASKKYIYEYLSTIFMCNISITLILNWLRPFKIKELCGAVALVCVIIFVCFSVMICLYL